MATKNTTFDESNLSTQNNTSSLTINIYFSAQNSLTYFQSAWLSCSCAGQTQGKYVSHPIGGSTWASFTFDNIQHNQNGEMTVGWSWACDTDTTVLGTVSASGTRTLTKINRYPILNYGSDFTDETNPVYNITSYNTFPIRVKLEAGGNTQLIIRDIPQNTNGNYTLVLTDAERNLLRSLTPDSNVLNVVETVCAMQGNTELNASFKAYKMTIDRAGRVLINGEWKKAKPYIRVNGEWKKALPHIRVNNEWKRGR